MKLGDIKVRFIPDKTGKELHPNIVVNKMHHKMLTVCELIA